MIEAPRTVVGMSVYRPLTADIAQLNDTSYGILRWITWTIPKSAQKKRWICHCSFEW